MRRGFLLALLVVAAVLALVLAGQSTIQTALAPAEEGPGDASLARGEDAAGRGGDRRAEPDDEPDPLLVITNVPGAEVTLRVFTIGADPDPAPLVRVTDDNGLARFPLPDHPETVAEIRGEARAPGYMTERGKMQGGELRLILEPGIAIRGRVMGEAGSPVPWAAVFIPGERLQYAGPDGTFEVFTAQPGQTELMVVAPSHLPARITAPAPSEDVTVHLDPGLAISGQVTFPDGLPVPGWTVRAGGQETRTEEDGRYLLTGFPPGTETVEVLCTSVPEPVRAGPGDIGVDFRIEEHLLRIRVVDEEGRPFRRGTVSLRGSLEGEEVINSSRGLGKDAEWLVGLGEVSELSISPSTPGWAENRTFESITGSPRLHEVTVVMRRPPPPGTIAVEATGNDGRPLDLVFLSLADEAGLPVGGFLDRRIELDSGGRGVLEEVPAGRYRLSIGTRDQRLSIEGFGLPDEQEIEVASGRTVQVRSRLPVGSRIIVRVRDRRGEVTAPRRVLLYDTAGQRIYARFIQLQANGEFTADLSAPAPALLGRPLSPGRYRVEVLRDDEVAGRADVSVRAGETADTTIRLDR